MTDLDAQAKAPDPTVLANRLLRLFANARRDRRPITEQRIRPDEMRMLEQALDAWCIEKTEDLEVKRFNGVLLIEDPGAPSLLP